jgi:hypothetical protein
MWNASFTFANTCVTIAIVNGIGFVVTIIISNTTSTTIMITTTTTTSKGFRHHHHHHLCVRQAHAHELVNERRLLLQVRIHIPVSNYNPKPLQITSSLHPLLRQLCLALASAEGTAGPRLMGMGF